MGGGIGVGGGWGGILIVMHGRRLWWVGVGVWGWGAVTAVDMAIGTDIIWHFAVVSIGCWCWCWCGGGGGRLRVGWAGGGRGGGRGI